MNDTYQVNELFHSVQGEGLYTGTAATFIRLQGCTVGCPWCDSGPLADDRLGHFTNGLTRNTWGAGGERRTVDEIVGEVYDYWKASEEPHIIITGGEPTMYNLDSLLLGLRNGKPEGGNWPFIQLETSGQNDLKGIEVPDWVTWSPKKNLDYKIPEEMMPLVREIKWVVDAELEIGIITETEAAFMDMVEDFEDMPKIILMPEGSPPGPETLKKAYTWAIDNPGWRVMDRLQYKLGVR